MGKKKLTNIRPREVSVVDNPANKKDFLVVKNEDGKIVESTITKKVEVSFHTLNFFKNMFPTKESCFEFLKSQNISTEDLKIVDMEYEFRVVVKDASKFEGHSLAGGYFMPVNVGVDGLVGIMKHLTSNDEEVEKVGAKLSAKRLGRLKNMKKELEELIAEVDKECTEVAKNEEEAKEEPKAEEAKEEAKEEPKAEEAKEEPKAEEAKEEAKEEPKAEEEAKEEPKAEEEVAKKDEDKDEEVVKSLKELHKSQMKVIKDQGETIKKQTEALTKLEEKVEKLMEIPADGKGGDLEDTEEIKKKDDNLFGNVL